MAVRVWKTILVPKDLARQKRTKLWPKWGFSWGLIDVWQNDRYYREVLERLRKIVYRVRSETADTRMLHHNAPCHAAISVNEFLNKKGIPVFPQPPYSPDLSPCDLFLFPKLKFHHKVIILQQWTISKRSWRNIWVHFHMKTSSTATGFVSNVSGSVWLPTGTILIWFCWFVVQLLIKHFIVTVSLLFRHSFYYFFRSRRGNSHRNCLRDISVKVE